MLVIEKRCAICKAVKQNKQLLQRIYDSSWFVPHSTESIAEIAETYGLYYRGLLNHVKRHQFIDSQDYTDKMLQQVDKQAEKKAVQRAVRATDAVQSIIDKGMSRLENEEITVDTNQLLRASQVKLTQEAKQKDQELATIEMVAHFLSGENAGDRVYVENSN